MVEEVAPNALVTVSKIDLDEISCVASECAAVLAAAAEKCLREGDGHEGYRAIQTLVERAVVPAIEKLASAPTTGETWDDARRVANDAYWLLTGFNHDGCDDMLLHASERLLKSVVNDLDAWKVSRFVEAEVEHDSV